MKQLLSVCRAKSITWRTIPNGDHNNTVAEPNYFPFIIDFVEEKALGETGLH